ncbi:MAG: RNA-binding protein, partial [Thaumarchaeota archaeon]
MGTKKNSVVLPGDQLAISEEYLPGKYAYDDSGRVRALLAGRVVEDMVNREISVKPVTAARTP